MLNEGSQTQKDSHHTHIHQDLKTHESRGGEYFGRRRVPVGGGKQKILGGEYVKAHYIHA
jgi:hypothetical protein